MTLSPTQTEPPFIGESQRVCVWITQLVVHSGHRGKGVAQRLCSLSWEPHSDAWGLVSSHPYAIRALETATARFCDPALIKERASKLVSPCPVSYIQDAKLVYPEEGGTLINTEFFVDHDEVNDIAMKMGDSWKLGNLHEGMEYFAFTFKSQPQTKQ